MKVLGFPILRDISFVPFHLWNLNIDQEAVNNSELRQFQDMIASYLIATFISEINETNSIDQDRLATLILTIQLISTNLGLSPKYATEKKKILQKEYQFLLIFI